MSFSIKILKTSEGFNSKLLHLFFGEPQRQGKLINNSARDLCLCFCLTLCLFKYFSHLISAVYLLEKRKEKKIEREVLLLEQEVFLSNLDFNLTLFSPSLFKPWNKVPLSLSLSKFHSFSVHVLASVFVWFDLSCYGIYLVLFYGMY